MRSTSGFNPCFKRDFRDFATIQCLSSKYPANKDEGYIWIQPPVSSVIFAISRPFNASIANIQQMAQA